MVRQSKTMRHIGVIILIVSLIMGVYSAQSAQDDTRPPITIANAADIQLVNTLWCPNTDFNANRRVIISDNGSTAAVTACDGSNARSVTMFDIDSGRRLGTTPSPAETVVLSPDGAYLLTENPLSGTLDVYDTSNMQSLYALMLDLDGLSIAISPDAQTMALYGRSSKPQIQLRDVQSGDLQQTLWPEARLRQMAFSQASGHLITRDDQHRIQIWDTGTGDVLHSVQAGAIFSMMMSGEQVAYVDSDGLHHITITTHDSQPAQIVIHNTRTPFTATGIAALDAMRDVVVVDVCGGGECRALAQSLTDGETLGQWQDVQHEALFTYNDVVIVDDGLLVIAYSVDVAGDIMDVWHFGTGQRLTTLEHPARWVGISDVQVTPDKRYIAALIGNYVALFGIATDAKPAYRRIPGFVYPATINLRAEPHNNSAPVGLVDESYVLVEGRSADGLYVYLPEDGGWVLASYVDIGEIDVMALPVRDSS